MKKYVKKLIAAVLAGVMVLGLAACASQKQPAQETASQETASQETTAQEQTPAVKSTMAAMIVSIPQGDPFLQLCYAGVVQLADEYGIEPKIIEALDKSEYSDRCIRTCRALR